MAEGRDFPFYNGQPVAISGRDWLIVLLGVALGFTALVALPLNSFPLNFIPPILFVAIPLGALAMVAGPHWTAVFQRYGIKQFGQSLGFGLLTIVVSFAVGLLLSLLTPMTVNPVFDSLSALGPAGIAAFLGRTFIQLVGEELTTMLPLLAVLWLCVSRFGLSKLAGIVIAVVVSTVWFAALHLPTYDWNIVQCLGVIGTARVVLTISYLVTRNVWVSAGAHIINDWSLFFASVAGSHTPIGT